MVEAIAKVASTGNELLTWVEHNPNHNEHILLKLVGHSSPNHSEQHILLKLVGHNPNHSEHTFSETDWG